MKPSGKLSGARILQIPYDSGRRNVRMGNGPARLVQKISHIKAVSTETVAVEDRPFELGTTMRVLCSAAQKVKTAISENRLPILLAGNCISTLASLSAFDSQSTALIWFDAHADFNTPETTPSGFIDGMALATITGRCWRGLTASIPGFRPLAEKNVVLIAARDLDPAERASLDSSEIKWLSSESIRSKGIETSISSVLQNLPDLTYIHLDLDVLDRAEARVNEYSSTGGLTLDELVGVIRFIGRERTIVGASITAYDPSVDQDSKALRAGVAAVKELLAAACIDVS